MQISYAVTCFNELNEIKNLIPFLLKHKREEDEIVVLWDENGDFKVWEYLINIPELRSFRDYFNKDFAEWKNKLSLICKGDYIFQLDADEIPHINLIKNLPTLLQDNQAADMIRVPRVNTVEGLTQEHIVKWGWNVNEKGWVNWADWQMRIYKNAPHIKWKNKVHEVLEGFNIHGMLPLEEEWALYHPKTIERQEKQNNYYNML